MRRALMVAAVVCLASGIVTSAQSDSADLPYAGTWRINLAKSDFGERTVTYAQTASGHMQFTAAGQSYTFQMDGTDYPSLFGGTSAWTQIDASTWKFAFKQNGKLISTATITLSAEDTTMTVNEKGPKPVGGTFDATTVYARYSGGPGLAGIWKTKSKPTGTPGIVALVPSGGDGLTIAFPDDREHCAAKFDGQDYPMIGPMAMLDLTLRLQKTSARAFEVTGKQAGKPIFTFAFTVSHDGQTLTQTGGAIGVREQSTVVYDRQ